jgi:hypothetical protein
MACSIDTEYIQKYIEGTLDPLEDIIIQEHIRNCPDCKKELNEMKLLLWELAHIEGMEIDVPAEAAGIRINVLANLDTISKRVGLKDLISLQKHVYKSSVKYLSFIPGLTGSAKLLQKGIKKAPSTIYMTAKKALVLGRKLSAVRARI